MAIEPAVSVIIPTHNCIQWLPRAIHSVGSDADIEIIVYDDGSTDGTAAWLRDAAAQDPRMVVLRGEGHGPSRARNLAIAAARAPLLAFLDADDVWRPGKLAAQRAAHARWPEIGFSFTNYQHVTESGQIRGTCFDYWRSFHARMRAQSGPFVLGSEAVAALFAENVVGTSSVVARTDLVREVSGFADVLPSSEDWDLWLRLARRAPVACLPTVLMDYLMQRPGNVTGKLRSRVLAARIIAEWHIDAVRPISPAAVRTFKSRLLEAEAELAKRNGETWSDLVLNAAAFILAPSWHAGREVAGALRRAISRISGGPAPA